MRVLHLAEKVVIKKTVRVNFIVKGDGQIMQDYPAGQVSPETCSAELERINKLTDTGSGQIGHYEQQPPTKVTPIVNPETIRQREQQR